tara:strand:- start:147 stop:398 length:252 start_codon:yes stop_codon:yes gene_type:complete
VVSNTLDYCGSEHFRNKRNPSVPQRRQEKIMTDLKAQEKLTDGKGWKQVIVDYGKEKKEQLTTKAKNIAGGVNVVITKLKGKD